ncbi:MAG: amino acid decarboxylase [Firmicutes bacterium]|nr:amino acid decarboxylase [Bacillota bacterium]
MRTPIADFVQAYADRSMARFHMPGHKGRAFLGCEQLDITEVAGADALYEAAGIIAESEQNATTLFGTARTCFSTEGSSQCIRAMLYLLRSQLPSGSAPLILAARNVHKAFVYAAALLDFQVQWLWPEESSSLCSCPISLQALERQLQELPAPPVGVYLTSPDYLGGMADIPALAELCHKYGTRLAVDNAHGAYLHFLQPSLHPMDLGADLCCDSAHKTLPVLTGGAYLHISRNAPASFGENAKQALALFGSTSPSYLIMSSLDLCNRYLAESYPERLAEAVRRIDALKAELREAGWQLRPSDPLRLSIVAPMGSIGQELAERLRAASVECEYADAEHLVLMFTPENSQEDLQRLLAALGKNQLPTAAAAALPQARGAQLCSIREAIFSPHALIPAAQSLGRICGAPTVSCPPAIPIAVSGEVITEEAIRLFAHYGVETVDVLK